MEHFSAFDLVYAFILSMILVRRAKKKGEELQQKDSYYSYYSKGLALKLFGTFLFCSIYIFYYQGGDTINYYKGALSLHKLFWKSPGQFFTALQSVENWEIYSMFDAQTGYPPKYMFKDTRTLLVIKIASILSFPGLGGIYATSVLIANLTYKWVWRGFSFTVERYPHLVKRCALCFLYMPSVVFWSSGIMKDTLTFAACCYALYSCHKIFILRENMTRTIIGLLVSGYLIINLKSYILFALLPGILVFLNFERIAKIKSTFAKIVVFPIVTTVLVLVGQSFFSAFDDQFGKYSSDRIFEEAALQQQDLTREVYGTNSFDIGEFDASLSGVISKAPLAINAALFRPYIWEVGSPTMVFSAIENVFITLAILYFFLTIGPFQFFRYIFKDPFLIFCFSFTIILAFGIGLSTANFGALVRYKIPFLPYFTLLFFIIQHKVNALKENNDDDQGEDVDDQDEQQEGRTLLAG